MELEFTAEQDELRDGVRSMLASECTIAFVRAVVEDGASPDGLWAQMVELGWPALTVPEPDGGLGLGAVELAVVVEELGRVLAPGPFVPTVTQFVPTVVELADAEARARILGPVAEGACTGTLALAEATGSIEPADVQTIATPDGDGWRLQGEKRGVLGLPGVDDVIVIARIAGTSGGEDGIAAFVVPASELAVDPIADFDLTRTVATVGLDDVRVGPEQLLGEPGPTSAHGIRRAVEHAVVGLALETVGTCQTIFDITLDYAKQREQFGVPIGSFQAIKHKFADMLVSLERARATAYFAALTLAEDDDRRSIAASTAKVAAADCQRLIAQQGIQIHGGIGYTWEHDTHLYVRRAKSDAQMFGTAADHRSRIADLLQV